MTTRTRGSRWKRWLLLGVALVVVVASVGGYFLWQALKPSAISAFYDAPSLSASDKAGKVLRTESIDSKVDDARLWRTIYVSTDVNGKLVPVSALVAAPTAPAPAGGYPVVVVAHGTVGINQACAPSMKPFLKVGQQTTFDFLVGQYVKAGYAVIMADFEGLGVAGKNTYLVGDVEAHNVLDSARAIKTFPEFRVQPDIVISGQSQGGHAALFAAQLAPTYAPDVNLIGVVALAPATDLEEMFTGVMEGGKRGGIVSLPIMAADAYAQNYPEVSTQQILTSRGVGSLNNVVEKLCLIPAILGTTFATPHDLLQSNALQILKPYVDRNIPGAGPFAAPILLAQGDADEVVPPSITSAYRSRLCAAGSKVTFTKYPGVGHFDVIKASESDVMTWIRGVRAGSPPPVTCP